MVCPIPQPSVRGGMALLLKEKLKSTWFTGAATMGMAMFPNLRQADIEKPAAASLHTQTPPPVREPWQRQQIDPIGFPMLSKKKSDLPRQDMFRKLKEPSNKPSKQFAAVAKGLAEKEKSAKVVALDMQENAMRTDIQGGFVAAMRELRQAKQRNKEDPLSTREYHIVDQAQYAPAPEIQFTIVDKPSKVNMKFLCLILSVMLFGDTSSQYGHLVS